MLHAFGRFFIKKAPTFFICFLNFLHYFSFAQSIPLKVIDAHSGGEGEGKGRGTSCNPSKDLVIKMLFNTKIGDPLDFLTSPGISNSPVYPLKRI
jgi:hypothetical protein